VLIVWSIIWKGFALWHAAKSDHKVWFVIILIINSAGIIPILYLYFVDGQFFARKKRAVKRPVIPQPPKKAKKMAKKGKK
jgi:hypothetical protein